MLHIIILIAAIGIIGLVVYLLSASMLLGLAKFYEFCKERKIVFLLFFAIILCYLIINGYLSKSDKNSLLDGAISVTTSSPPLSYSYSSKSYSFEGIYKSGYFDNCCFNGESKRTKYSYLQLPYKLKIKWDDQARSMELEFDQIQIGSDRDMSIADGTLIKLQCKELWEGNNGHYALWVYCSEPVLSVY